MAGRVRPIDVLIRGVDQVSTQIADVNRRLDSMNGPARRAGREVGTLSERLKLPGVGASLSRVGTALSGLVSMSSRLVLGGGIFGAGALMSMKKFIDYGDDIGTVSARIGVGSTALQELRYAAEQLDLPQEQLDDGLDKLSKNMGNAIARGGQMAAFFQALGVDLKGGPLKAIETIADRIKGLSPELQREVVGTAFGRGNAEWVNALREGSPVIARYRKEAAELGFVLDEQTVSALGEADVELRRLKFAALGAAGIIGTELLPDVREMVIGMTEWIKENRGWIRESVVPEIRNFVTWLRETTPRVLEVIEAVGGFKTVAIATGAVIAGPLILAMAQLGLALGGLLASLLSVEVVLGGVMLLVNPWVTAGIVLGAIGVALYQKWEPFRNMVDWIARRAGAVADWWSNSATDPKTGNWAPMWPYLRDGRAPDPAMAGLGGAQAMGPASGYAGTPHLFTGNIGVDLTLPRGASGMVGPMKASPGLGLDVGLTQGLS